MAFEKTVKCDQCGKSKVGNSIRSTSDEAYYDQLVALAKDWKGWSGVQFFVFSGDVLASVGNGPEAFLMCPECSAKSLPPNAQEALITQSNSYIDNVEAAKKSFVQRRTS